jgi:hypothetical protein
LPILYLDYERANAGSTSAGKKFLAREFIAD